jgi:DNA adenine methylase
MTMICRMVYPGGKGKCFQRLINLMPPHAVYIETHLGGGAVLRNKRPAETNIGIDADSKVIEYWRNTHPHACTLVHADAVTFLDAYPYKGDELLYIDPPYLPELRRRAKVYRHDYARVDHERLLTLLLKVPCMVMISGYPGTLYEETLLNWRRVSFRARTQVETRTECVWMNFEVPTELHDGSFMGHTSHERQSVRRRHSRLLSRFSRMKPQERVHLLELLNSRYCTQETSQ